MVSSRQIGTAEVPGVSTFDLGEDLARGLRDVAGAAGRSSLVRHDSQFLSLGKEAQYGKKKILPTGTVHPRGPKNEMCC
jgi:hypothetical protein